MMLATQRFSAAAGAVSVHSNRWFSTMVISSSSGSSSCASVSWKSRFWASATTIAAMSPASVSVVSSPSVISAWSSIDTTTHGFRRFSTKTEKSTTPPPGSPYSTTPRGRVPIEFLALNNLRDNPGAVKKKRRKGRGIGSSKGKTCGRGHKGQGQRGHVKMGFEGGQTPLWKRLPKRGMKAQKPDLVAINLHSIQAHFDMGRFPPGIGMTPQSPLTLNHLVQSGLVKGNSTFKRGGIKLLADGKLTRPLHFVVGRASRAAIQAVEEAGGSITVVHYNDLALRQELRGDQWRPVHYRQARPSHKYQPYYTNWNQRGYLHPAIQLRQWFQFHDPNGEMQDKFNEIRTKQEAASE